MSDRYTRKMADGVAESLNRLHRESGVYRVRMILQHGETDLSPGMTTAREAWLYARGALDALTGGWHERHREETGE